MNNRYNVRYLSYFLIVSFQIIYPQAQFNLPVTIGPVAYSRSRELLFVGANQASTGDAAPFAVSVSGAVDAGFSGIASQQATISGQAQANPIFGSQISYLATMGRANNKSDWFPAVVLTSDPTKVYFITQYTQPPSTVVVSPAIPDAAGNPTSGIQALSGSGMGSFFTAVAPQAGAFGDAGSGISLGIITTTTQTGEIAPAAVATPVDRTSSLVATSTALPLATLDNPLLYTSYYIKKHMGEDEYVGTLFAGFHAVSGSDVSSTVRAVVSSYTQIGASFLALQPIVAVSALGTDSIIGAAAPDTEVTIHQLATLFPSIGTQYLVVVGGVGPDNTDPVNVYAMPLTSQGQLASINQPPLTIYSASIFFDQRQFVTPATSPSDLYTSTDTPAIVGGGSAFYYR